MRYAIACVLAIETVRAVSVEQNHHNQVAAQVSNDEETYVFEQNWFKNEDANMDGIVDKQEFCDFYGYEDFDACGEAQNVYDTDGNGEITWDEHWAYWGQDWSEDWDQEWDEMDYFNEDFYWADQNGDGVLDQQEAADFSWSDVNNPDFQQDFAILDADGDGVLSQDEAYYAWSGVFYADYGIDEPTWEDDTVYDDIDPYTGCAWEDQQCQDDFFGGDIDPYTGCAWEDWECQDDFWYQDNFSWADVNGDGEIDIDEAAEWWHSDVNNQDFQQAFSMIDGDGNGVIDFSEGVWYWDGGFWAEWYGVNEEDASWEDETVNDDFDPYTGCAWEDWDCQDDFWFNESWAYADANGDGVVDKQEGADWWWADVNDPGFNNGFDLCDANGDGVLDQNEAKYYWSGDLWNDIYGY